MQSLRGIHAVKFSVCLDAMYFDMKHFGASPRNCLEGMQRVKNAGFDAVEFFGPNKDVGAIAELSRELSLEIAAITVTDDPWSFSPGPDFRVPFISLCDAENQGRFLAALRRTMDDARQLNCRIIITHAGNVIKGVSRDRQRANIVASLKQAGRLLESTGLTLVVEPINAVDHPGDFIESSEGAFSILQDVDSENVKLLYDIYHMQVMEGNLIPTITKNITNIAHLQGANNPGRGDVRIGEINYPAVLNAAAHAGYDGFFGVEYGPGGALQDKLPETADFLARAVTRTRVS